MPARLSIPVRPRSPSSTAAPFNGPGHAAVVVSVGAMTALIQIGGRSASMADARDWVSRYFNESNRDSKKPYAYPAYDHYDSGSGPFDLNDGDLLAPALLNATPSVQGFYSLQRVRPRMVEALGRVPVDANLLDAIEAGTMESMLGDLVSVLDAPEGVPGIQLTKLVKVLHRKRPAFIPLWDKFVRACYLGEDAAFPLAYDRTRSWCAYAVAIAEAMSSDLIEQQAAFDELHGLTPQVSVLRVLDVVAWNTGKQARS